MGLSRPGRFLLFLAAILLIAGIAAVSREWWLQRLGDALIHDDGPAKADIAVVLAGDYWGNRIVKGGQMVRLGYVPAALVSGPAGFYGHYELHRRNTHSMLLVTSDYHTRRALRIFSRTERKMGGGMVIRAVAAPDEEFHPDSWWRSRQGQKVAFMEWTKTLAQGLGF